VVVVLPDAAMGERHREHITGAADALPGGRPGQVVVAVPARLRSRIRDQLEDRSRPGRDLAAGADHARRLLSCHAPSKHLANGVTGRAGRRRVAAGNGDRADEICPLAQADTRASRFPGQARRPGRRL